MAVTIATGVVTVQPDIDEGGIVRAANQAGQRSGDAFSRGMDSRLGKFSGAGLSKVMTALRGSTLALSGAALGAGAAIAGVGVGIIGLGALALKENAKVKSAFSDMTKSIQGTMAKAATPLVQPFVDAAGTITKTFQGIAPQLTQVFANVAPSVAPLVDGLSGLITNLMPGLQAITGALKPVMDTLGPGLADLGSALSGLFEGIAGGTGGAAQALGSLFSALKVIVPALGQAIGLLAEAGGPVIAALLGALTPLIKSLLGALAPAIAALGPPLTILIKALGAALTPIIDALGPVLDAVSGALGELVKSVAPLLPIFGELIASLLPPLIPVFEALGKHFQMMAPVVKQLVQALMTALAPILAQLPAIIQPLMDIFNSLVKGILPILTQLIVALAPSLASIGVSFGKVLVALSPLLGALGELVGDLLLALMPILTPLIQLIGKLAAVLANVFAKYVQNIVVPAVGILTKLLHGDFSGAWRDAKDLVQKVATAIADKIRWLRDQASALVGKMRDWVVDRFTGMRNSALDRVTTLKNSAVKVFTGIRDSITGAARTLRDNVVGAFNTLKTKSVSAFSSAKDAIKTAWNKLKEIAASPVRFVIETVYNNGIRKVWNAVVGAFGGHKLGAIKSGFARGGVLPGQSSFRNGDDQLVPMRRGEGVYVSEAMRNPYERARLHAVNRAAMQGKSLAPFQGGQGFALGGIFDGIGDALGGAWDKTKKGFSWLKDTFGGAIQAGVKHVVNPLINQIPGKSGFTGILKSSAHSMVDSLIGAGKKGDKLATPKVKYNPSAGVEQWRPVVLQALREVNQSAGLANSTLRRMQQESGGNPNIVNKWDSNWQAGHPSVGLMQVIGPTFRAYAGKYKNKGPFLYGTSVDPMANVFSSMRYALGAYGSLSRAYDRPGGYDSGGWLPPGPQATYNGTKKPEAVLTDAQWGLIEKLVASSATPNKGGVHIESLTLQVDASQVQEMADVIKLVQNIKISARQHGARI
ncbi:transglycosylase SLT domain-containing protein [Streptomyces sp. NBC_01275]|uniref:transglycosylase SLT domain-containing protein n=1 Tax=Streptomyces sp. NBC_01275 TaxID=2903807 RepID=UPI00225BEF0A|nr:transglycosylase SLT domain-containing protein [Streptomyces sp. NBC_01275]MCX4763259.1 transglycosylase SLT domain-containing protein [Streptomyces sp. NBC_01275]